MRGLWGVLCALIGAVVVSWTVPAQAQADDGAVTYLWLPRVGHGCNVARPRVEQVLFDVLANARDSRHIVGVVGLQREVEQRGFELPVCMTGLSACSEPLDALIDALQVSVVVNVTLTDGCKKAQVDISDPLSHTAEPQQFEGRDLRDVLFKTAGEVAGSKGEITVTSRPTGATVYVNDEVVGETPLHLSLNLGPYRVRVEADGYTPFAEEYEVRAGDRLAANATLARNFANLSIFVQAPGAHLLVGTDPTPRPVNEAVRLQPGEQTIAVVAPGYDAFQSDLHLIAGEDREISVVLYESREAIDARNRARVEGAPLLLALHAGYRAGFSDWKGASRDGGGELTCPLDNEAPGCLDASAQHGLSVGFEPLLTWRHLQVMPLGGELSFTGAQSNADGYRVDDGTIAVGPSGSTAWRIRFLQAGWRALVSQYVEPHILAGFAYGRNTLTADQIASETDVTFERDAMWLELAGGARFHLNPLLFADTRLQIATDLSHGGDPEVGLSLGFGVNLPDPTGLNAWMSKIFPVQAGGDDNQTSPPRDL